MKKKLFFLVLTGLSFITFAQVKFEKGYFIDSNNQKIECYIKNEDWAITPTSIRYKLSNEGEIKSLNTSSINELGIYNFSKFKRFEIKIYEEDFSRGDGRDFKYKTISVLLNALLDGDVALYEYNGKSFVIQKKNEEFVQLISLRYTNKSRKILKYEPFRKELSEQLKCDAITATDIKRTSLAKRDLVAIIKKYNKCKSLKTIEFTANSKTTKMNVNLRVGLDFSSFNIAYDGIGFDETLNSNIGYFVGFELEFILPFNKGKWGLLLEPSYRSNSASKKDAAFGQTIDASSNELLLSFGLRHYMFLNDTSSFYITGNYNFILSHERSVDFSTFTDIPEFINQNSISFSVGFKYKKKYYTEIKYNVPTRFLPTVGILNGYELTQGGLNLIVGYRLF